MRASEYELRRTVVKVGQLMYEKGFICASDGNVSVRLGRDRFLITPSGLHKGLLTPDDLLVIDASGRVTGRSGELRPTSEMPMHLEAYRQRPDISAVVHAHPPISIALSIAGIPMADCLLPEVIVFLGLIPTTEYATPSTEENVRAIRDLIGNHDGIVLQRHGSLTVGQDPMQAFMRLETLEQNARIGFMLAQLGVHNPLPAPEVEKLLRIRAEMGLMRPGETAAFCTVCGVCHEGAGHAPTLHRRPAGTSRQAATTPDAAAVRHLVTEVVQRTLGHGQDWE